MQSKKLLRNEVYHELQRLSPEVKAYQSLYISEQLTRLLQYHNAQVIMAYAALDDEVSIDPFVSRCLLEGKTVLFPKIVSSTAIDVTQVLSLDEMTPSKYGILESPDAVYRHKFIDLIVVPGVAFDKQGQRLGRGKGYYDRFLHKYPESYKVGVGYSVQYLPRVPTQEHDIRMDMLIIPPVEG